MQTELEFGSRTIIFDGAIEKNKRLIRSEAQTLIREANHKRRANSFGQCIDPIMSIGTYAAGIESKSNAADVAADHMLAAKQERLNEEVEAILAQDRRLNGLSWDSPKNSFWQGMKQLGLGVLASKATLGILLILLCLAIAGSIVFSGIGPVFKFVVGLIAVPVAFIAGLAGGKGGGEGDALLGWDAWACLETLKEVASALAYLHERNIVHGDLKAANVLLAASERDRRGYVPKLADMGFARVVSRDPVLTRSYATVTHQPPELLIKGETTLPWLGHVPLSPRYCLNPQLDAPDSSHRPRLHRSRRC